MITPPGSLSNYSDASSSYWPQGWNFDRYVRANSENDNILPDDERNKMQAGFRDVLGDEGVTEMTRLVSLEQLRIKELKEADDAVSSPSPTTILLEPPDWLVAWRRRYQGQPWGFVAFRTAASASASASASATVEEFETRVREIAEIPLNAALEQGQSVDDIAEARGTFEIRWIDLEGEDEEQKEEEKVDPVERMRTRYRAMIESGALPPGLSSSVFLCASPLAVASVLETSYSDKRPGTESSPCRSWTPFLLAVAAETEQRLVDDEVDESVGDSREKDWFKPVFRVAAKMLLNELWWVVAEQITTLGRMTRFVQEASVTEERQGDDGDLDAIWWTVHTPPRHMRKSRRLFTK